MSIKTTVKVIAMDLAPRLTMEFLSNRSQRLIMGLERQTGAVGASKEFCAQHGTAVVAGPFRGMHYPQSTCEARNLIPKLVASYEDELHPWIEEVAGKQYGHIVNIGSADGYYTVGLAMRCPNANVIAFDTDHWARKATDALARENKTANVTTLSFCTIEWLANNLKPGALLLVDCEGWEAHLLDVDSAPILKSCDLLVELHDSQALPGIAGKLRGWFSDTHDIRTVSAVPKVSKQYPALASVSEDLREAVISEGRHGPQDWFFMTLKTA